MSEVPGPAALPGTVLERGRVVPGVGLRDLETGGELRAWDHRGRRALLLCFLHEACDRCGVFVRSLEAVDEDVSVAGARVVHVGGPGRVRFLGETEPPVLLVVDRDGAAWESYPAAGHAFPPVEELASTLWHLATMCPECGVEG